MTEALRVIAENTAKFAGGSVIKMKYYDIISGKHQRIEQKSGEEIAADIVKRAGLEIA